SADINEIKNLCKENKILLLEDNCESLGSMLNETLLGNFGFASTFSFFVGHHLSTVEGGMVCTNDKQLYNMLCMVRAHGWDRHLNEDDKKSLRDKFNLDNFFGLYTFYYSAYNARPTEITGFLGNNQIEFLDRIISKRIENFNKFYEASNNNEDILKLNLSHMSRISNFAFPLIFKNKEIYENYKKIFNSKVEIRPIIAGNIQKHPFFKNYTDIHFNCPNADFIHEHSFYFGNNPEMTDEEISLICNLIKNENPI
ncbi:MAG: DegT/DnrJ/EryC1/StrS family aminotransferase, partial [archaeon]|nr:DegT/DnrJ/EryC1/StrS family aminotransferase [archaeon]